MSLEIKRISYTLRHKVDGEVDHLNLESSKMTYHFRSFRSLLYWDNWRLLDVQTEMVFTSNPYMDIFKSRSTFVGRSIDVFKKPAKYQAHLLVFVE